MNTQNTRRPHLRLVTPRSADELHTSLMRQLDAFREYVGDQLLNNPGAVTTVLVTEPPAQPGPFSNLDAHTQSAIHSAMLNHD